MLSLYIRIYTIVKGKESASISKRHANGNAHQLTNQKKPKGKNPIHKGEKYYQKESTRQKDKKQWQRGIKGNQYVVDINAWRIGLFLSRLLHAV